MQDASARALAQGPQAEGCDAWERSSPLVSLRECRGSKRAKVTGGSGERHEVFLELLVVGLVWLKDKDGDARRYEKRPEAVDMIRPPSQRTGTRCRGEESTRAPHRTALQPSRRRRERRGPRGPKRRRRKAALPRERASKRVTHTGRVGAWEPESHPARTPAALQKQALVQCGAQRVHMRSDRVRVQCSACVLSTSHGPVRCASPPSVRCRPSARASEAKGWGLVGSETDWLGCQSRSRSRASSCPPVFDKLFVQHSRRLPLLLRTVISSCTVCKLARCDVWAPHRLGSAPHRDRR